MARPCAVEQSSDGPRSAMTDTAAVCSVLIPAARLRHSRDVWKIRMTSISPRATAAISAA